MKLFKKFAHSVVGGTQKGFRKFKGLFVQNKEYGEEKYLQNDNEFDENKIEEDVQGQAVDGANKDDNSDEYYYGHIEYTEQEILDLVNSFQIIPLTDISRIKDAHPKGGKINVNKQQVKKYRSIAKEVIKTIGKKILTGQLNLTRIGFPIKAMVPMSALEKTIHGTCTFPLYMNLAVNSKGYIERFKFLITAILSSFIHTNQFVKPLNPILGETLEAKYNDGTKLYSEQISHHPPISYFLVYGPNDSYVYSGYYNFEAKAGMNSLTLINTGKRTITFADGQQILFNFTNEYYSGSLFGQMKLDSYGVLQFIDEQNSIECVIKVADKKQRVQKFSDYFYGDIKQNGEVISKVSGSYLGYIEFDGKRYWDHREAKPAKFTIVDSDLKSDHTIREDKIELLKENYTEAQVAKEVLEQKQRNDRKLREDYQKQQQKLLKKKKK